MIKVGLTGGIGSGKSTVAKIFETLKIPIFYADLVAKEIINSDKTVIAEIKNNFGNIYTDGRIEKQRLSNIIFNSPEKLQIINSIVHPAVGEYYQNWLKKNINYYFTIMEAAILFESGTYKQLDKIITVFAPEKLRIKRVSKRDNIETQKVKERINNQMSENKKIQLADYVIYNDDLKMLIPQVIEIAKKMER